MQEDFQKPLIRIFLCVWISALLVWVLIIAGAPALIRHYFVRQPEVYRYRVEELIEKNDLKKAESLVRSTAEANPYDIEAHFLLADILYKAGNKTEAYLILGKLESLAPAASHRKGLVIGYDPGRIYYQLALWDFDAGRIEQGVNHLLRVVDETPIYIDNAPSGFLNIRGYLAQRIKSTKSNEGIIHYCRVLDALGEQVPARQILGKIAQEDPEHAAVARLVEAEMNLLAIWFTMNEGDLRMMARAAKSQIDSVLASNPGYLGRLWGTLLIGNDHTPAQPLTESALMPLIGDRPVLVLKPRNFELISHVPQKMKYVPDEKSFNIYSPGKAQASFHLDTPARSLWILVRGTTAMAVWPYITIRLDGKEIARRYLRHFAYRPYQIPVEAAKGSHTVEVEFFNDEFEKPHQTDTNVYLRALLWMPEDEDSQQ